jgi:hypothetical protein
LYVNNDVEIAGTGGVGVSEGVGVVDVMGVMEDVEVVPVPLEAQPASRRNNKPQQNIFKVRYIMVLLFLLARIRYAGSHKVPLHSPCHFVHPA